MSGFVLPIGSKALRRKGFRRFMDGVNRPLARSLAVVVSAFCAAPVLPASPAWAPKYILGAAAYGDCLRRSTDVERFEGLFEPTSFDRSGSSLLVTGVLSGVCLTDATAEIVATLPPTVATFPVVSVDAFCDYPDVGVHVRPGSQMSGHDVKTGDPAEFLVDLTRGTTIEQSWTDGDPVALRGKLCALDRIADRRPLEMLAPVLDTLVRG